MSANKLSLLASYCLVLSACDTGPVVSLGDDRPTTILADASVHAADAEDPNEEFEDEHECSEREPVCGIDGVTYFNSCRAREVDAGIAHAGACK